MKHVLLIPLVVTCLLTVAHPGRAVAAEPQLAHMVYFKLLDSSPAAKAKLIAACQEYLDGHDGTLAFAVGTLAEDLVRDVNDRDFDVALHVLFVNRAAHDAYQNHPRHLKFIEEHKASWANVRVFDSYVSIAHLGGHRWDLPLPDAAASFAGMIVGRVVATRDRELLLDVQQVARVWEHSRAQNAQALVKKRVRITCGASDAIARFVSTLKADETVELDVAHKGGEVLTILELTPTQRERAK